MLFINYAETVLTNVEVSPRLARSAHAPFFACDGAVVSNRAQSLHLMVERFRCWSLVTVHGDVY
jgi:hypothetical protein